MKKLYTMTAMSIETIERATRKTGGKIADRNKTIRKTVRRPVYEVAIEADSMTDARAIAAELIKVGAAVYSAPLTYAVNLTPAAAPLDAACAIAYRALNLAYSKQALDFIRVALDSIAARAAAARDRYMSIDDIAMMDCNAADVISTAATALFGKDYSATYGPDVDRAAAINAAPVYSAIRAAYAATNKYIHDERGIAITTARQDINHYLRISDDAADAEIAADYDNGYIYSPDMSDADAIAARAEYIDSRADARAAIRRAFDIITPKQRDALKAYAESGNMRTAAARLGLKNQSTVARHIQAARRAIDSAAPVDLGKYAAADSRHADIIKAARADADARAAIDYTGNMYAADVTARFGKVTHKRPAVYDRALTAYDAIVNARADARAIAEKAARRDYDRARAAYVAARDIAARRRSAAEHAAAIARRAVADADAVNDAAPITADGRAAAVAALDSARELFARARELADAARDAIADARAARATLDAARRAVARAIERPDADAARAAVKADADARRAIFEGDAPTKADNIAAAVDYAAAVKTIDRDAADMTDADAAAIDRAIARRARRDAAAAMTDYMQFAAAMTARAAAARAARK